MKQDQQPKVLAGREKRGGPGKGQRQEGGPKQEGELGLKEENLDSEVESASQKIPDAPFYSKLTSTFLEVI